MGRTETQLVRTSKAQQQSDEASIDFVDRELNMGLVPNTGLGLNTDTRLNTDMGSWGRPSFHDAAAKASKAYGRTQRALAVLFLAAVFSRC